jgi:hypothetical protein
MLSKFNGSMFNNLSKLALVALVAIAGVGGFGGKAEAGVLNRACYTSASGCVRTNPNPQSLGRTNFALNLYGSGGRVNAYNVSAADNWMKVNLNSEPGGTVSIRPVANSNECYTADYAGNNSPVRSKPCNGSALQRWYRGVTSSGANNYKLSTLPTNTNGVCLNLTNSNLYNGGYVFVYECPNLNDGDIEQLFFFE